MTPIDTLVSELVDGLMAFAKLHFAKLGLVLPEGFEGAIVNALRSIFHLALRFQVDSLTLTDRREGPPHG